MHIGCLKIELFVGFLWADECINFSACFPALYYQYIHVVFYSDYDLRVKNFFFKLYTDISSRT